MYSIFIALFPVVSKIPTPSTTEAYLEPEPYLQDQETTDLNTVRKKSGPPSIWSNFVAPDPSGPVDLIDHIQQDEDIGVYPVFTVPTKAPSPTAGVSFRSSH